MRKITDEERRRRLGVRHFLSSPAEDVESIAERLVGLHSSDPATVYLSVWARSSNFHVKELEDALYEARSVVRMLGMRRTMFVVTKDIAPVMDSACTRALAPIERRRLVGYIESQAVASNGSAWLAKVEARTLAALADEGEATANHLSKLVPELATQLRFGEGKRWEGTVAIGTRLLFLLAAEGRILRARPMGSWRSSQYRWTSTSTWLDGELPVLEPEHARARLAGTWLRSFGPATVIDLKWWSGWTVAQTKRALADIGAAKVELESGPGYALEGDLVCEDAGEWVAILPSLDSTIMGWKEREWFLAGLAPFLFDSNGNAGPTVWWNGRVVGGWGQLPDGRVVHRLLQSVPKRVQKSVQEKTDELTDWLDGVRIIPRFRSPLNRELAP